VRSFLNNNKVGINGMLETKAKDKNVDKVATKAFPGWYWHHNFEHDVKGKIWLA